MELTDREKVIAVWIFYGKSGVDPITATERVVYHCCVKLKIDRDIVSQTVKSFGSFIENLEPWVE